LYITTPVLIHKPSLVEEEMTIIRHDLRARCAPERVWALLSDLEAVARYNPGVAAASVRGTQRTGIGAMRTCDLKPKGRVAERVTVWEEGAALGLEVAESDWPIHFMRWVTRVSAAEDGSRLTQDLEYRVKFGPLGWALDRLVMERKLRSTLDAVMESLIRHAEAAQ
jgi:hypothetical protein